MANMSNRLRKGAPNRLDHITFRLAGAMALAGFGCAVAWLRAANLSDPVVAGRPAIWLIALAAVVCLFSGLALVLVGPGLLMPVACPQRWSRPMARGAPLDAIPPSPVPQAELQETWGARMISRLVGGCQPAPGCPQAPLTRSTRT